MLEARALSFAYNAGQADAITALDRVSVQIAPGELVAIIGHNGSGKSTLAKLLCAVFDPTGGEVIVDGLAYQPETIWEVRRRVGMVFQRPDDQIVANIVIDDVAFGPENLGLPRDEIEQRVADVLALLGLEALGQTPVSELSAGEKQRLAIAGVLAMQPAYLILDEPTTMLAPGLARHLIDLLHALRARLGMAIVHITHFIHEVVSFDRVIVLDGGRVLLDGPPREVFAHADTLETVGLAVPPVTALARRLQARGIAMPGVVLTADELTTMIAAHVPPTTGAPTLPPTLPPPASAAPLLETRDLRFTYLDGTPLAHPALRGVSCCLFPGETLAVPTSLRLLRSVRMSFEISRAVTFGQYLNLGSPLHRLDPRTKLLSVAALMTALMICRTPGGLAVGLLAAALIQVAGRIPLGYTLRGLRLLITTMLFLFIFQALFYQAPPEETLWSWWLLSFSWAGVRQGAVVVVACAVMLAQSSQAGAAALSEHARYASGQRGDVWSPAPQQSLVPAPHANVDDYADTQPASAHADTVRRQLRASLVVQETRARERPPLSARARRSAGSDQPELRSWLARVPVPRAPPHPGTARTAVAGRTEAVAKVGRERRAAQALRLVRCDREGNARRAHDPRPWPHCLTLCDAVEQPAQGLRPHS